MIHSRFNKRVDKDIARNWKVEDVLKDIQKDDAKLWNSAFNEVPIQQLCFAIYV
jgi:hypothetical protein